jgi:hypothetical protein
VNKREPLHQLDVIFGSAEDTKSAPYREALARTPPNSVILERQRATLAFVANQDAIAFKLDGDQVSVVDLSGPASADKQGYVDDPVQRIRIVGLKGEDEELAQSEYRMVNAPTCRGSDRPSLAGSVGESWPRSSG